MIEDARSAAFEELQPGDETRLFYTRKPWKRVIVMFAGPVHEPDPRGRRSSSAC